MNLEYIKNEYLPSVVTPEVLADDKRDIQEQLASVRLYDRIHGCPTYAAIILFGKNPRYYLPGAYVQFVRFAGKTIGGEVLNEKRFHGPLFQLLPALESFVSDAIITQRPVAVSLFREKTVINYPNNALRELMMNACMHRDYQEFSQCKRLSQSYYSGSHERDEVCQYVQPRYKTCAGYAA